MPRRAGGACKACAAPGGPERGGNAHARAGCVATVLRICLLPMFTPLGAIDVLGNIAILVCGVGGYVLKKRETGYQPVA